MAALGPLFCDITWGAGGTTADLTLEIAARMQRDVGVETMMHLTCTNMPVEQLDDALDKVREGEGEEVGLACACVRVGRDRGGGGSKRTPPPHSRLKTSPCPGCPSHSPSLPLLQCLAAGITNILALRGDPPKGQDAFTPVEGGFACALDLVRHIRARHGDAFGIAVAGYPEAHPDVIVDDAEAMAAAYQRDLAYLKQKVDAGADLVVTQLFYDASKFTAFEADCRAAGITVPIIPGIMPIMTYGGFKRMTSFCKTYVPASVAAAIEPIQDDDEAVKAYGVSLGTDMCRSLLEAGVPGIHLYTLNLERSAVAILENLGLVEAGAAEAGAEKKVPAAAVA